MKKRVYGSGLFLVGICVALYTYKEAINQIVTTSCSYVVYPILKLHAKFIAPFVRISTHYCNSADLIRKVAELTAEKESLQAELIEAKAQVALYDDVQELLTFRKRYYAKQGCITNVIGRHLSDKEQYILIDAGSRDGISCDMAVIYKNTLVGKVADVYPWYSKVLLVTDRSCKVAVYSDKNRASGLHEGNNDQDTTMVTYINHLSTVQPGELLLSSGHGLIFPQGLGVARIVDTQQSGLYHQVKAVPLSDVRTISYCMVIAKEYMHTAL